MKTATLILRIFAVIMSIVMMILIFNFSADDAEESGKKSEEVTEKIVQTVDPAIVEKPIEEQKQVYESVGAHVRRAAHFLEFSALGFFTSLVVNTIYPDLSKRILIPLVCGILYAVIDEVHQIFVPGRACEFVDILIDTLGVSVGILISIAIFAIIKRFLSKKERKSY